MKSAFGRNRPPDGAIALENFHNEIEAHLSFLRDVNRAHSIALVVNTDTDAIAELAAPEEEAQDDRDFAMHLSGFIDDDDDYIPDEAAPSASYPAVAPH
ncbi:IBR finger domain-containing protein [Paraphaeosphaeria sporulosa]